MRTSLVKNGFVAVVLIAMLGSGCSTLHRWWYGPDKTKTGDRSSLDSGTLPPEPRPGDMGSTLVPGDKPLTGEAFDKTRTVDPAAIFAPVHFAYDSFVLPPQEVSKIDDVAKFLAANMDRVVNIDGHCDERGSNEYNLSLGEQRAQSVRKYLLDTGIDASRVQTRSFGKEKPLDPGHNEGAWAKNRRGEFIVYK